MMKADATESEPDTNRGGIRGMSHRNLGALPAAGVQRLPHRT